MNVKLDLSGFRIESLAVSVDEEDRGRYSLERMVTVILEMRCLQRDTKQVGSVAFGERVERRVWERMTDEQRVKRIRCWLYEFLRHELDECLLVNDVRVFDPHKDEWKPKPAALPNLAGMTVDMTTLSLVDP